MTMLPVGQVVEASPDKPYLCIRLNIDAAEVAGLLLGGASPVMPPAAAPSRGLHVARVSFDLLDAVTRLLRLLQTPQHAPALAPLALREIFYRVLTGELARIFHERSTV
jgi:hypothetical protein